MTQFGISGTQTSGTANKVFLKNINEAL